MGKKEQILQNLRGYSAEQLVNAIQSGIVTYYELNKTGQFTPLMKKRVKERLDNYAEDIKEDSKKPIEATNQMESIEKPDDVNIIIPQESIYTDDYEIPTNIEINDSPKNDNKKQSNKRMFKAPFSFKGRIRRLEYGLSYIIISLLYLPINVLEFVPESEEGIIIGITLFYLITVIPLTWFGLAQGAKRCHDRGNSGWWQLIPFYGFWMLFANSESGTNKYGNSPK